MIFPNDGDAPVRAARAGWRPDTARCIEPAAAVRLLRAAALVVLAGVLASCSGPSATMRTGSTKEHFSSKVYGKASPRVVKYGPVPKGGGRYVVGDPYRVAGRTYVPRDNPNYSATGYASWYGSAFHGRKTSNGEIYDVNGLTAAHPTLPLPSYARVTNLENGRSLIVRVNDRGPFKRGRIIDLSARAASMLDFQTDGTAKVRVDYMGAAPLDGHDEKKLLASFRDPAAGRTGTMFAWNGPTKTPDAPAPVAVAMAPIPRPAPVAAADPDIDLDMDGDIAVAPPMALMPYPPPPDADDDPLGPFIMRASFVTSFAATPPASAAQAAAADLAGQPDLQGALDRAAAARARALRGTNADGTVVQLGAFGDPANAKRLAADFSRYGRIETRVDTVDGRTLTVVAVALNPAVSPAAVLDDAGRAGLKGAYVISR